MARDPQGALVALNRFGYGARGGAAGDLSSAASDPRGFVKAELNRPNATILDAPGLEPTPVLTQAVYDYQKEVKQQRQAMAKLAAPAEAKTAEAKAAPDQAMTGTGDMPVKDKPRPPNIVQKTYRAEALARLQRATMADCGIVERLVAFWSNHFCISAGKGQIARMWAGAYEREAIRPHVLGRFADMVMAVEQHPAMLFFLDNQQSIGPDSRAGQRRNKGLNENLAREIMELHTLGVNGGYTQADVTALARILTGWTFVGQKGRLGPPGTFVFNANAHEPGAQRLLGKTYPDDGVAQGEAALKDIARHSATARFIAHKFATHFVADDPPPALVERLATVFTKTDGDLRAMTMALLDADAAWQAPMTKMRTPYDFLVASGRLLGRIPEDPGLYLGSLSLLGQPLWTPPGPNGFADTNAAWSSPEGMKLRLDVASRIATRVSENTEPLQLLDAAVGTAASHDTRQAVARAETRQQAVALLLMSPEFQRR
jgi:uncharacterized protein (DUF1800 family)